MDPEVSAAWLAGYRAAMRHVWDATDRGRCNCYGCGIAAITAEMTDAEIALEATDERE